MALSEQTKISVEESIKHLREALAFASRADNSNVVHYLSQLLLRLEDVENYSISMDMQEKFINHLKSNME